MRVRSRDAVYLSIGTPDSKLGYARVHILDVGLLTADEADVMADEVRACAQRARALEAAACTLEVTT